MTPKSPHGYDTRSWNPVPEFPGYVVSSLGEIQGPSGRILKPQRMPSGHLYVQLRLGGRASQPRKLWLHHAVLTAFVGERPRGQEGRHLNGDPADNRLCNLAWGTRIENQEDDRRNGVVRARPQKLTLEQATDIRQLKGAMSSRAVAALYGLSHTVVLKIWRGRIWARRALNTQLRLGM